MTTIDIRRIDLAGLDPRDRAQLTRRRAVPDQAIREGAAAIVAEVRSGGDDAVRRANERYGGGLSSGELAVAPEIITAGRSRLDRTTVDALQAAIDAIEACHRPQLPRNHRVQPTPGVLVERRWSPLRRVAVYVPGGRAPYPSSLLMGVVPARIAGVSEIVVATPAGSDGIIGDAILAAAEMAGATEVYAIGGAQAVAALAYGTETITPVDKIVGPGNAWVTAAKLAVFGDVAIDLPAGPSEALVLTDGSATPRLVAVDMICQAEHGPDSPIVLVTTRPDTITTILAEIARFLPMLEREQIVAKALSDHGLIVTALDIETAIDFANDYAPEHLTIHTSDSAAHADQIHTAGSVFVGHWAPESAGDYATGANHILPTGGQARAHGPLGVADFGSWLQVQHISRAGLEALRPTIAALSAAEGLTAHRLAAEIRFDEESRP